MLYTNTFSILPALFVCVVTGELSEARLATVEVTNTALGWVLLSCAIGIGISWAGFWCQSLVSATTYAMLTQTPASPCLVRRALSGDVA